jgi:8-oxo-dGTP diphosphatase
MVNTEPEWKAPRLLVAVDLVILTLRDSVFHVLLVERGIDPFKGHQALPGGFLKDEHEDLFDAALRELKEEANLDGSQFHLEQLGAYGTPGRDPRDRVLSVAFLAITPALPEPDAGTDAASASWTPVERVLSGAVPLAFDHLQILGDAVERARSKLEGTPLATAFCDKHFTIAELRGVYEAVWGTELDERNFYRKVQSVPGFIEPVKASRTAARGRPARLFRTGPATALLPPITRPELPARLEDTR